MHWVVIMWVQLIDDGKGGGQVRLYAEVGRLSDHDFRRDLIEDIKAVAKKNGLNRIGFQRGAADEGKKYSKFFKQNFFTVKDVHDHDQIANAIKEALKSFRPEIAAVAAVLPKFLSHGSGKSSE
jgi:hypothetical protein